MRSDRYVPHHPDRLWRRPSEPKLAYDVVVIGGGGHGLSTAYYLARNHGITDVAVLERGWLAGGNMARNTAIIRSNYLWDESAAIYEHALRLWEGLAEELDYDLLFSQRGVVNLAHNLGDVREGQRRVHANRLNGVDADWLTPEAVREVCPIVNISPDVRYPILGATYQPRGGIAKHDNVAWAYARAAADLGVDLLEGTEVTGIDVDGGRATGVRTSRGRIAAGKVAIVAAGHASIIAAMAGIRLPLQSHPLQALVSELLEPVHPCVVMSNAVHVYVSQADKGEKSMRKVRWASRCGRSSKWRAARPFALSTTRSAGTGATGPVGGRDGRTPAPERHRRQPERVSTASRLTHTPVAIRDCDDAVSRPGHRPGPSTS